MPDTLSVLETILWGWEGCWCSQSVKTLSGLSPPLRQEAQCVSSHTPGFKRTKELDPDTWGYSQATEKRRDLGSITEMTRKHTSILTPHIPVI